MPRDGKPLPWYVEFVDETRSPIRKRLSLRTLEAETARLRADQWERQWIEGTFDPWTGKKIEKGMSYQDAVEHVCEIRYCRLAESTYTLRRYVLLELFGRTIDMTKGVKFITVHHLRGFLNGYEGHTYSTFYNVLRTFFNDCGREQIIKFNPFDQLFKTRERYPVKLRIVEAGEYQSLVEGITSPWMNTMVQLGYQTGMRHGEMRHLRWEHVHFDSGLIEVKNTEWYKTKTRKDRTVPMPNGLGKTLTEWRDRYTDHCQQWNDDTEGFVLPDKNGNPPDLHTTVVSFRANCDRLGLSKELTLHKLRHSFASNCVRHGMPLEVLKEILGHSNIQTTLIYAHFQTDDLKFWVDKVFGDN